MGEIGQGMVKIDPEPRGGEGFRTSRKPKGAQIISASCFERKLVEKQLQICVKWFDVESLPGCFPWGKR